MTDETVFRDNANTFLRARGVAFAEVVAATGMAPDQPIVLGGSVAEGFGTPDSDIDLLTIADAAEGGLSIQEEDCAISTILLSGGAEVSLERYSSRVVTRLTSLMDEVAAVLADPASANRVPTITAMSDLRFLHRLRTSFSLTGGTEVTALRERLRLDLLPQFVLLMSIKLHFAHREDALAERDQGSTRSAAWCIRSATSALAGAFLATLGHSHHNDRWRIRLLEGLADEPVAADLLNYMVGAPIETDADAADWVTFCNSAVAVIAARCPVLLPVFARVSAAFPIRLA